MPHSQIGDRDIRPRTSMSGGGSGCTKSAGKSAAATPEIPEPETMNSASIDPKNARYLQMGGFPSQQNADRLLQHVTRIDVAAYLEQADNLFKVKSGPYVDADRALQHKLEIDHLLIIEARVVFE